MLMRVLGLGVLPSRMIRWISARPAWARAVVERRAAAQQLVQEHAEGVDVAAGVDILARHLGLFGAHVGGRADHLAELGVDGLLAEPPAEGFGDSEVDDLWNRAPSCIVTSTFPA